jgi:pimeloyl-ACP methyl ester carboxylesterase
VIEQRPRRGELSRLLAYDRTGRGEPLVLLHPLGAHRQVWEPIVERLRDRRELIAVDLPGFGDSPPLQNGTPTPRALAAAVAGLMESLGIARPHVAGNSLGGWVALELGLLGAVRTVVGISPAGLWPGPLVPKPVIAHRLAHAVLPLAGAAAANPVGRRLLLGSAVAHPGRVPRAAAAGLVRAYARAPGFKAVNDAMRAGVFTGLERIRVPVTLVWPEHDRVVNRPPWLPDNVRSIVLQDAGHVPMWDAPDELARVLLERTAEASSSLRRTA